jgi:hypothetical protein
MARKVHFEESGFTDPSQNSLNSVSASDADFEAIWRKLSTQRNTALALSPQLDEWFGKEFPPQIFET